MPYFDHFLLVAVIVCAAVSALPFYGENDVNKPGMDENQDRYCQPQTPCAWQIFGSTSSSYKYYVRNEYCRCVQGVESCQASRVDIGYVEYRCRKKHKDNNQL